jgi:niacin transporter
MAVLKQGRLGGIVLSAMMAALAVALPPVFHIAGLGSKFLPLLLPLLFAGFLLPWRWAVLTGAVAPWLSAVATGMPPVWPPVAAALSVEGAAMGGAAALIYRRGCPNRLWLALFTAVVCGRAAGLASTYVMARWFDLPAAFASLASALQGLPGVALMFVSIPLAVRWAERRESILFSKEDAR